MAAKANGEESAKQPVTKGVKKIDVLVPACFADAIAVAKNPVRQVLIPRQETTLQLHSDGYWHGTLIGGHPFAICSDAATTKPSGWLLTIPDEDFRSLSASQSLRRARWSGDRSGYDPQAVLDSLVGKLQFVEEDAARGVAGLRPPQLGALHSILGYWTTARPDPATVVMPTGTGKTDRMVAVFAVTRPELVLVVVPSDALRDQLAGKFETLGVLPTF